MSESTIKDVPGDQVGTVVQSFVNNGKRDITCTKNASGTWTVTAS